MAEKKSNTNNMAKNIGIREFIEDMDVDYCIIIIGMEWRTNKKIPVGLDYNIKSKKDPLCEKLEYMISEKNVCRWYYAYNIKIKNSDILIIDIDEDITLEEVYKIYPDLEGCFYTIGNSKGYHFYTSAIDSKNMGNSVGSLNHLQGDFIKEQIWEREDKLVYGEDILSLGLEDIQNYFKEYPFNSLKRNTNNIIKNLDCNTTPLKTEIENIDELREIVDNIPVKFSNNYTDWIKIVSILKKYNQYEMALSFSKKSKTGFSSVEDFDDWYTNKTIDCDRLTIATIFQYSKNNITNFNKIKNKYKKLAKLELLEEMENNSSQEYLDMKTEFEDRHFLVIEKICYIKLSPTGEVKFLTKEQILNMYLNKKFNGLDKKGQLSKIKFVPQWIEDEDLLTYEDCDYYPNPYECPDNHFNLWTDFDIKKNTEEVCTEEDLQTILNHIKIMCGNDDDVYEYMLDWFAHIFVYPEQKIGIIPIFQSKDGAGKSMILDMIKDMIGLSKCCFTMKAKDEVFGVFNKKMAGKIFVELAELDFMATKGAEGIFKSSITDPIITITAKGKDPYDEKSYHRFIASTNDDIPIKINSTDRRILLIDSSNEMIGNVPYFTKLLELVKNKSVQKGFYEYLINRDTVFTSPAEARRRRPTTYTQSLIVEHNKPKYEEYFEDLINRLDEGNTSTPKKTKLSVSAQTVYDQYKLYCVEMGIECMSQSGLGLKLAKRYKNSITKKRTPKVFYIINFETEEIKDILNNFELLEDSDSD